MSLRFCARAALFCLITAAPVFATPAVPAKQVIEQFYRNYLSTSPAKPSRPPFSQAFQAADAADKKFCREYARKGDVCGWDGDSDPYLDAQDYDDNLTYENAVVSIREPRVNRIAVTLSLFPPHRTEDALRTITYVMVQEQGRWVVDDIHYSQGPSARKSIRIAIGSTP